MTIRNIRLILILGGFLIFSGSLLPWYSIGAKVTAWQESFVLGVEVFMWGIRLNGSIPPSIAGEYDLPQLGTKNYLELMEYIPSEYGIYLYFPLAILALAISGSLLVLLGALKSSSKYFKATILIGSILSLGSAVLFVAGLYVAWSQIGSTLPIHIETPFFGEYSTSILVVSVTLSWGLSYGWVGTLIGSLLSWMAFFLPVRQASVQPVLQATFRKPEPKHVYCIYCRAVISPDALFCQKCGRKQE